MNEKPNVLVVCGRNKRRSRTAEYLFRNDQRLYIRSVGLSPKSRRVINEKDVHWADLIFVMEQKQATRIKTTFRNLDLPKVEVLSIPDEFTYLQPALVELIQIRMNESLKKNYEI